MGEGLETEEAPPKTTPDAPPVPPKPPPHHVPTKVICAEEEEHLRRTREVQAYLGEALGSVVDAIERRHEPYEQPKEVNLFTDEPLEPRLTSAEKLNDLVSSYSAATASRNICSFCVINFAPGRPYRTASLT